MILWFEYKLNLSYLVFYSTYWLLAHMQNNLSFWEQSYYISYDFIVIGAGITGLSTACEIKEQQPTAKVLVLERGLLPTGASTKNAGFACIGTVSEKVYDSTLMGVDALIKLVKDRYTGLNLLRNRLGDENLDYQNNGGYEIILNNGTPHHLNRLNEVNNWFYPLFNQPVFIEDASLINTFGFNKSMVSTIIKNPFEGQINTGLMMKNLAAYTAKLGVEILTGANVTAINSAGNQVDVVVESPNPMRFKATKVAVCTNAFTTALLPQISINPGRGQVICTEPIDGLQVNGTFNFDEGFYYFRNFNNRIIFGGGRNLDFETENTLEFGQNQLIIDKLKYYLTSLIVPNKPVKIACQWSGIMAFGKDKLPVVKLIEPNIAVGARLNGMGIALGSKIAKDLAGLLI